MSRNKADVFNNIEKHYRSKNIYGMIHELSFYGHLLTVSQLKNIKLNICQRVSYDEFNKIMETNEIEQMVDALIFIAEKREKYLVEYIP